MNQSSNARCLPAALGALLLLLLGSLPPLEAQTIRGRVLEAESEAPVEGARVVLVREARDSVLVVLTDSVGQFTLTAPGAGRYQLQVRRIGYALATTPLFLLRRQVLDLDLLVEVEAVAIAPVTATIRSRREQQLRALGGRWIERAEIEPLLGSAQHVGAVLQWQNIPGLWMREVRMSPSSTLPSGVCIEYGRGGARGGAADDCRSVRVYLNNAAIDNAPQFLLSLRPADVERMVLLRPQEASVLYGASARNGVLLIYTRGNLP